MWYIRSQLGDEPHYKKQYMKKMEYTTKTGYNPLSLRNLGGGIGFAVTSSFTYRYRAFRRCQMMAQAEGFVRFRPPDADVLAHCQ